MLNVELFAYFLSCISNFRLLTSRLYPAEINLAIANAQPAANAPIIVTRNAPAIALTPVILLLKYPKTKRHIKVIAVEIFNPSIPLLIKKYGESGINPPTI